MYYKLEQACVTNCSSFVLLQIRENVVTNWGSFIIINWGNCCYKLGQQLQIRATQGFKNQKSWYTFFCAPNNIFAYTTVHSNFLHLKQLFVHACRLTCTSPCTYHRVRNISEQQKVNLGSISIAVKPEPSLATQTVFIEK